MAPLSAALEVRIERSAYPAAGWRWPIQALNDIELSVCALTAISPEAWSLPPENRTSPTFSRRPFAARA
jgi:hypothetical protein